MSCNDNTFFTNEEGSSLLTRFQTTLENNTQFFDVLVGYFRSSGFFNLYKSLEQVKKIRILVGLNVDQKVFEMLEETKKQSSKEIKESFSVGIQKELENSEDNIDIEEGIAKFMDFILKGRLEIKVYKKHPIHAKVYIIRKDPAKDKETYGKIITGSSNFSQNGLVDNLEFNVELKDKRDVTFALEKFEELWKDGVNVSQEYVDTLLTKTHIMELSPYELYLKYLYEYFGDRVNDDRDDDFGTEKEELKNLQYQNDAIKEAIRKLHEYNGVFLADVVGLGKTYMASKLARKLGVPVLIICPPTLIKYWREVLLDYGVAGYVESLGKLEHILKEKHEKYKYVFIDEAHRFRNDKTKSYENLKAICTNKKVVLISATPFNNTFNDLFSLITLFQSPIYSKIPNLSNIENFFKFRIRKLDKIDRKKEPELYAETVKNGSKEIREKVLKYLMVRRTRHDIIENYKQDFTDQGLRFPKPEEPISLNYEFDDILDKLFMETLNEIVNLTYARYTPSNYVLSKVKNVEIESQKNIKGFMKTLLVKRLESSFYAFRKTLSRIITSYEKFLDMYNKGDIYVSKKVNVYDLLDEGDIDKLLEFEEKGNLIRYKKEDFPSKFKEDIESDLKKLTKMIINWSTVTVDPKLDRFKEALSKDKNLKNKKVIVFSESKETVDYLERELQRIYDDKVLGFSSNSSSERRDIIKQNFDPKAKKNGDNIRILLTTDVLSEGVNLHRSNIVMNYDIPWNPVRILQRVGRVNRVGTKYKNIFIYNFFPTAQSDKAINLQDNVKNKLNAFIELLGEDAKHLTDEENPKGHALFEKMTSANFLEGGDERNPELTYLQLIRSIRDSNYELFEKIRKLPRKSRTARKVDGKHQELLTFFRKGNYLKTYFSNENESTELDFESTVNILECKPNEKTENLQKKKYFELLNKNKESFEGNLEENKVEEIKTKGGSRNKAQVISIVRYILQNGGMVDTEEKFFQDMLKSLILGFMTTETIKKVKQELGTMDSYDNSTKIFNKLRIVIPEEFLRFTMDVEDKKDTKLEIILNEYLI